MFVRRLGSFTSQPPFPIRLGSQFCGWGTCKKKIPCVPDPQRNVLHLSRCTEVPLTLNGTLHIGTYSTFSHALNHMMLQHHVAWCSKILKKGLRWLSLCFFWSGSPPITVLGPLHMPPPLSVLAYRQGRAWKAQQVWTKGESCNLVIGC